MKKNNREDKLTIDVSKIPLEGSLGLLAYGDIAFKAWRKIKKNSLKKGDEEE